MKPLIYSYMRVASDAPDDEFDDIKRAMRRFAEVERFCYATTFHEYHDGSQAAFNKLAEELKRAEANHVVVPSFEHLSRHRLLCRHMVERLEARATARSLNVQYQ